jgi:hypothetical protein
MVTCCASLWAFSIFALCADEPGLAYCECLRRRSAETTASYSGFVGVALGPIDLFEVADVSGFGDGSDRSTAWYYSYLVKESDVEPGCTHLFLAERSASVFRLCRFFDFH